MYSNQQIKEAADRSFLPASCGCFVHSWHDGQPQPLHCGIGPGACGIHVPVSQLRMGLPHVGNDILLIYNDIIDDLHDIHACLRDSRRTNDNVGNHIHLRR
jgi:hypothetical protein